MTDTTVAAQADRQWNLRRTLASLATRVFAVAMIFLLVVLVGLPVFKLIVMSTTGPGGLSLGPFAEAFGKWRYVEALGRSFFIGISVAAICTAIGVPMAWFVSRTNIPGRGFIILTIVATYVMPPYLGAVAWMLLAGPNAGWINRIWRLLSGAETSLVNIYSMEGLIFLIGIHLFPLTFIFTHSALGLISTELEDAAAILGAGRWKVLAKITLPMIWPAILSGALISMLEAVTLFGTPAMIGIPAGITVGTTQIWQFFEFPPKVEAAAAYSLVILLLTMVLLGGQRALLARKGFVSVTGKGGARRIVDLGPVGRWLAFAACGAVALVAAVLPALVILQAAFTRTWSLGLSAGNFTLENFDYLLFRHGSALGTVLNTLVYSAAAATLAMLVAMTVAYVHQRRLAPLSGVLALLCVSPIAIPAIVLGLAFYATFAPAPFRLYGTAAILILAFTIRFLPIGYLNIAAVLRSLNPEMEDAVRILGAGRFTAVHRVIVPILRSGLLGAWLIIFVGATRELSTALFLTGPDTKVMSVLMLDLSEEGNLEVLSALGVLLLAISGIVVFVGRRFAGRDFMLGRV